jgi:hypothetical protein
MSKIAKFGKKTQGMLGVIINGNNECNFYLLWVSLCNFWSSLGSFDSNAMLYKDKHHIDLT